MIILTLALIALFFWIGFHLTSAVLSAVIWVLFRLPCAVFIACLGVVCCVLIIFIPIGIECFKLALRILLI